MYIFKKSINPYDIYKCINPYVYIYKSMNPYVYIYKSINPYVYI